ncbi:hypothetical protein GGR54DRAFT_197180 [Hypoxylon sp. NC1633]|nr:hypothetical protein GGR54DRAFT_197180 [Hypoxylon sp. NC1633]
MGIDTMKRRDREYCRMAQYHMHHPSSRMAFLPCRESISIPPICLLAYLLAFIRIVPFFFSCRTKHTVSTPSLHLPKEVVSFTVCRSSASERISGRINCQDPVPSLQHSTFIQLLSCMPPEWYHYVVTRRNLSLSDCGRKKGQVYVSGVVFFIHKYQCSPPLHPHPRLFFWDKFFFPLLLVRFLDAVMFRHITRQVLPRSASPRIGLSLLLFPHRLTARMTRPWWFLGDWENGEKKK